MITGTAEEIKEYKKLTLARTERMNNLLKAVVTVDISNVKLPGIAGPGRNEKLAQKQKH